MKHKLLAAALSAVLLLSATGCAGTGAQPGVSPAPVSGTPSGAGPIKIATKPMTEQYILGEMLKALIEAETPYACEITKGIGGGTSNIQPAMEAGEFDLYPEYTSSGWVMVLGHKAGEIPDKEMLAALQKEYQERFGMTWLGLYGFNNTFTVAVRTPVAEQYDLKTCSDLAAISAQVVFGGNPDYIEREDGFGLLCETYGMDFKAVKDIDIGLKYQALATGEIDVTNAFTTDAQLSVADVKTLEDDLHLQANYYCSTVVRMDALERYPGLEETLLKLDGILSDQEMAKLNYAVEADGRDEAAVARDFLSSKGLLEG